MNAQLLTALAVVLLTLPDAAIQAREAHLMRITVHNPTDWSGPGVVEVPIGRLATPGQVDWRRVKLMVNGRDLPWSVREGRPHWKAALELPIREPRAEDLLVFPLTIPPGGTGVVDLAHGRPAARSAITRRNGRIIVRYPQLTVDIDERTGLLTGIRAHGKPALTGPLSLRCTRLSGDGLRLSGSLDAYRPLAGTGQEPAASFHQGEPIEGYTARLVSRASTAAMTELHFLVTPSTGPAMALTYRIHAAGMVEICADERPWTGRSPWLHHALAFTLPLAGRREPLDHPLNIWPHYGFKEFVAVTRYAGELYRSDGLITLELGEETINGRRWNRRLMFTPDAPNARVADLVMYAHEGYTVEVAPMQHTLPAGPIRIACPESAQAAARVLVQAIRSRGGESSVFPDKAAAEITLRLTDDPCLSGDGFAVRPSGRTEGIHLTARTVFGLMSGALRISEQLCVDAGGIAIPVIAANPVVDLRAGGLGGGSFEVDVPYGTDAEWEQAFDGLIASGMNVVADLSMWGNWKMPVSYKYMPELWSDSPDAFDELSGTAFHAIEPNRARGLKLLRYLQERGVKVWQWIPIGCVPTTYAKAHPEAMAPGSDKIPCFTHPLYARYIDAVLREMLETYPLDGLVMIRDDNGGLCSCARCQEFVARSRTGDAAWEQYLIIYDRLKQQGFRGDIAVYPYFDFYTPHREPLLPEDVQIVGHGAGLAVLTRSYETQGPMGDTWIDNLFAGFRLAPSTRMKRLLSDRGSFWIGGAFCGTELPWQSIGYFGWEPTATVNTFRHWWGRRTFGAEHAQAFTRLNSIIERMWDMHQYPMLPRDWMRLTPNEQRMACLRARALLQACDAGLTALQNQAGNDVHGGWFAHLNLWRTSFAYQLRRLEITARWSQLVSPHSTTSDTPLPADDRRECIGLMRELYTLAAQFDAQAALVPGDMIAQTRAHGMTQPYREWMAGYDFSLDAVLPAKQFDVTIDVPEVVLRAGHAFTLPVRLQNRGICPWLPEVGFTLQITGDAARLRLPGSTRLDGEPMAFGDTRTLALTGQAPDERGEGTIEITLRFPSRTCDPVGSRTIHVRWE